MNTLTEDQVNERATGRLFGLSDGVFAIAMTLLALDLRVPDEGDRPADHVLVHALLHEWPHYLAFLISFYVIASYWRRHNTEMRTVQATHPALLARTLPLLLAVCALPFAAELLGTYGGQDGIAIAVYAGINVLAVVSLLTIRHEARRHRLSADAGTTADSLELWFDLVALLLAVPAGYLFPGHGVLVLVVLLLVGGRGGSYATRRRAAREAAPRPVSPQDPDA
ncbi:MULTISPECIES: TMEM175 family protein [Streptacidiphilus]|uniref:TMEM175 family protein n=1 Tax=Streptacidiphilus cavernicola TaxID=3342716 RepID=A0ABV6UI22_9ACTN|nr:TMEM175 family protein [Streptacidiphilus jeojiense]